MMHYGGCLERCTRMFFAYLPEVAEDAVEDHDADHRNLKLEGGRDLHVEPRGKVLGLVERHEDGRDHRRDRPHGHNAWK